MATCAQSPYRVVLLHPRVDRLDSTSVSGNCPGFFIARCSSLDAYDAQPPTGSAEHVRILDPLDPDSTVNSSLALEALSYLLDLLCAP